MKRPCQFNHVNIGACRIEQIAGRPIHWVEAGRGPVIVMVHGSQAWSYTWRYQIEPFADAGFRVIAVDLPGNGYSDVTTKYDDAIRGLSSFLVDFLDALDIPLASFVANSAGGLPVLDFAIRRRNRVSGLVLASTCGVPHKEPPLWRLARLPVLGELIGRCITDKLVRNMLRTMVHDRERVSDEMVTAYFEPLRRSGAWKANLELERNWQPAWVEHHIHKISVPVLIVWGQDDRIHPVEMAKVFARRIPDSHLEIFPNCGHLIQEERPSEFNALTLRFITKVAFGYPLWNIVSNDPIAGHFQK